MTRWLRFTPGMVLGGLAGFMASQFDGWHAGVALVVGAFVAIVGGAFASLVIESFLRHREALRGES